MAASIVAILVALLVFVLVWHDLAIKFFGWAWLALSGGLLGGAVLFYTYKILDWICMHFDALFGLIVLIGGALLVLSVIVWLVMPAPVVIVVKDDGS